MLNRRRRRGSRGFAIPMLALISVLLFGVATLAVDVGSRYSVAARMQRAADAAALAGVTVLPSGLTVARTEARQVAARNGFEHGVNGVTVDVDQISPEKLQVRIEDPSVPQYFANMFDGKSNIVRKATAKFVRAVSLGSPRNFIGTGNLLGSSNGGDMRRLVGFTETETATLRENFWLAISGTCSSRENGDKFNTISMANYGNTSNPRGPNQSANPFNCTGSTTVANPEYRDYGYIYAVTVPAGYTSGEIAIQVYDPAVCNNSRPGDTSSGGMATSFTVRTGSIDPLAGTEVARETYNASTSGCSTWRTLATVNPGAAGVTYYIQVEAGQNTNGGTKTNGFALRARVNGASTDTRFWGCSSDPVEESLHSTQCPKVYSVADMGVYASLTGARAQFFLAEIGPEYNGKQLEITLFDPGEGAAALRIKDPNGDYADFDWEVDCRIGITLPTGGCSGADAQVLDLIGDLRADCSDLDVDIGGSSAPERCSYNPQPGERRVSRWKYNDRSLTLKIQLPEDIADAYDGATWWKVEYETNTAPTDRTTWSVQVQGDPVRLIPNP